MKVVSCGLFVAAYIFAVNFGARTASSQEPKPASEATESKDTASKQHLAEMHKLAETIKVTVGEGEQRKDAKLIAQPVLRFSDPSRLHSDGSVWAWKTAGRPVMMTEFRTADRTQGLWGHDLVATSDVRIAADVAGHGRWAPREPDFKLQPVPHARAPANTELARLRQMKQFARRLHASQVWQGQQSELRLLPTEIHRYSDAANELIDGAAFAFANGTNPEAILFVEAHKTQSGETSWKFGLARMSAAAITFRLDDTVVWEVPQSFGAPDATYYAFTRLIPGSDAPGVTRLKNSND